MTTKAKGFYDLLDEAKEIRKSGGTVPRALWEKTAALANGFRPLHDAHQWYVGGDETGKEVFRQAMFEKSTKPEHWKKVAQVFVPESPEWNKAVEEIHAHAKKDGGSIFYRWTELGNVINSVFPFEHPMKVEMRESKKSLR